MIGCFWPLTAVAEPGATVRSPQRLRNCGSAVYSCARIRELLICITDRLKASERSMFTGCLKISLNKPRCPAIFAVTFKVNLTPISTIS